MGKKFINTGNSDISFGKDLVVLKKETIELDDDMLKEKADAIRILIAEGKLTEPSKLKSPYKEEPKKFEKPEVNKE